jgi:hypothetical protein
MPTNIASHRGRFARFLIVAAKIFGALLFGLILLVFALMWSCAAPSDESLSRRFERHRAELEMLSHMFQQDTEVIRIADDFTRVKNNWAWPRPEDEWGITSDRWDQYRRLFGAAGVKAGLEKDQVGNVYFIVHTEGFVTGGSSKGFVHCLSTGDVSKVFIPCAAQREEGRDGNQASGSSYHKLAPDWYIFEEWD